MPRMKCNGHIYIIAQNLLAHYKLQLTSFKFYLLKNRTESLYSVHSIYKLSKSKLNGLYLRFNTKVETIVRLPSLHNVRIKPVSKFLTVARANG